MDKVFNKNELNSLVTNLLKIKMLSKTNRCDLFLLLWVLYYLQGTLYTSPIINRFIQLIMLIWLLIAFISVLKDSNKPSLLKATTALFGMYFIYGVLNIIFGSTINIGYKIPTYFYLKKACNSLFPIFMFYYYTCKGYLTEQRIRVYFFVFLIVSFVLYFRLNDRLMEMANDSRLGITNNVSYNMLALIPLVYYFYRRPTVQYFLLGILLVFILTGAKRGAILIAAICLSYFILVSFSSNRKRIYAFFMGFIFLGISYYYVEYSFQTNEYLQYRMDSTLEGDSSNRDIIYSITWDAIKNESSVIYLLFGHGADATLKIIGNFAHQDWLEIAYNNGIIGVFLFLMFFVSYYINIKHSRRLLPKWQIGAFVTVFIIGLLKTFFSAFIVNLDLCMSVIIGYTLAELSATNNPKIEPVNNDAKPQL